MKAVIGRLGVALRYARENKVQTLAVAVAATDLVVRFVPGFPVDSVLDLVRALIGA